MRERLGEVAEPFRQLGGGLANDSIRVGDRVLRIYRRDVESLAREAALLERSWQHVRVPEVLERGDDYLLLEFVEHTPLSSAPEQAAAVGRALAEAYGAAGGALPDDWRALARTLDLVNLAGLLDGSEHGSRRREDLLHVLTEQQASGL